MKAACCQPRLLGLPLREYLWMLVPFVLSLGLLVLERPWVHGDGVAYFVYLRSAVLDGDWHFANEYEHYAAQGIQVARYLSEWPLTPTGHAWNGHAVGTALLWAPFYLVAHGLALGLHAVQPAFPADGYSLPYVYAVALGSAIYAFLGLVFIYALVRRYFDVFASRLAVAALWVATSLTAYMYFHPTLSHPSSLFVVAGFVWFWHRGRGNESPQRWAWLGLLGGVGMALRWQNGLFMLLPALESLQAAWSCVRERAWPAVARIAAARLAFLAALAVGFAPQMVAWWVLFGVPLADPQSGAAGRFNWLSPHLLDVLVSSRHGLLTWTPIVAVALVGAVLFARRAWLLGWGLLATFAAQAWLIGSFAVWWAGASFGQRYFIEMSPLFALGLAQVAAGASRRRPGFRAWAWPLVLAAGVWNLLFIYQYGAGMLPFEDDIDWSVMLHNQFFMVPRAILQRVGRLVG